MRTNFSKILPILIFVAILSVSAFAQSKGKPALKSVASVDLRQYVGKWYEIGKYPNKFQKQCIANTTATYTQKENGRIEVSNNCVLKDGRSETAVGEAKIVDKKTNSKLKVRFAPKALSWLPIVWGDYWIIDLDSKYQYVAIGEPKWNYFWILSRQSTMDDATYQSILRRAEAMGFEPGRVEKTPQNAEILKGSVMIKN